MIVRYESIPSRIITMASHAKHATGCHKTVCPIHGCKMDHVDSLMVSCPQCAPGEDVWYMGGGRARQFTAEVKRSGEQIFGEGGRMV